MRKEFPIFQSHLDVAHSMWRTIVKPGDTVIDATCGNGHDTLVMANLALKDSFGTVYAIDLQEKAIESAQKLLQGALPSMLLHRIRYICGCHSSFPKEIKPGSVSLIVYNLGYLPGSNKSLTTLLNTTKESLVQALDIIKEGGLISITCYPGHPEGEIEEKALLEYVQNLNPRDWCCTHQRWVNRSAAPSLLLIQKAKQSPA